VNDLGEIQYEYIVSGKTYVTVERPLFDFRAECIEGRATRVWKVYDKHGDKEEGFFALKDLWMFSDTQPEGEILKELRQKVPEMLLERDILLNVVDDDWVYLDNGSVDKTDGVIMRYIPTIKDYYRIKLTDEKEHLGAAGSRPKMIGSQRNESHGHTPRGSVSVHDESNTHQECLGFSRRSHRRTVFKEVCQPLHDLEDIGLVYLLLQHAVRGESLSFRADI
jgi:hypothetical protein